MCGIAGIFHLNGKAIAEKSIKTMIRTLAHRGPDGEDVFVQDNIALGKSWGLK